MRQQRFRDAIENSIVHVAEATEVNPMVAPMLMVEFLLACLQQAAPEEFDRYFKALSEHYSNHKGVARGVEIVEARNELRDICTLTNY